MKKIIIIIIVAFIVIVSIYEINTHYNNPVMVVKRLPNFPVHSDFSLHSTNTNIVRMHIIDVNQPDDVLISRARRAVVERKVGVIYLKGNYSKRLVSKIEETLKRVGFKIGVPKPFIVPKYINIASATLLIILFSVFFNKKFLYLLILPVIDFKMNVSIYLIYLVAFIVPAAYIPKDKKTYFSYFLMVITVGSLTHFLFFQTKYIVGASYPRGIKAILILPFIYFIYKYKMKLEKKDLKVLIILGILGVIYIIKSGNYIEPTIFERRVRDWMDTIFYVRPRFKELLVGFPLLWIVSKYNVKNKFVLLLSIVGYISILDSFLHPYTDSLLSSYRSFLSLILGIPLGEIYFRIYKRIKNE